MYRARGESKHKASGLRSYTNSDEDHKERANAVLILGQTLGSILE